MVRLTTASFTPREVQLLEFASAGLSDKLIAKNLNLSVHTVAIYWKRLLQKTDSATRTSAVALYRVLQKEEEVVQLRAQLLAITLYCNMLEGAQQTAGPSSVEDLAKSSTKLFDWLKTPLHHVIGTASLSLEQENVTRKQLEIIYASATLLTKRIDAILDAIVKSGHQGDFEK